ncbi:NAD(P)-dependent oxidoreductase [Streptomyces spinoverrucosus]|uniref:NAD(P)-dependent oxidoreductase n=1 Tax=Streptomyces spinoverrucosus TaxID=284043 RepID=UPI0035B4805A
MREALFDGTALDRLTTIADTDPSLVVRDFADPAATAALARAEALLTGWGCPPLTGEALARDEFVSGCLNAVLDVTDPEVLARSSPLYDLPNVLLTPHIAGSLGNELHRMTHAALDELDRYARGLPYTSPVHSDDLTRSA